MNSWKLVGAAVAAATLSSAYSASAGITSIGVEVYKGYYQNGPSSTILNGGTASDILRLDLLIQSPSDFTEATVAYPGAGSPETLLYNPVLTSSGAYAVQSLHQFSNLAALNAAYPFGTYTFTANNSVTSATQTASMNYNANNFPREIPALSPSSYQALQGMNPGASFDFDFNSFAGGGTISSTSLAIFDTSQNMFIYSSPNLSDSTTSFVLPANTLSPGKDYRYEIFFFNQDVGVSAPSLFNAVTSANYTYGTFTTATGGIPEPATWTMLMAGLFGIGAVSRSRRALRIARVAAA
jgi:hypothetical protein